MVASVSSPEQELDDSSGAGETGPLLRKRLLTLKIKSVYDAREVPVVLDPEITTVAGLKAKIASKLNSGDKFLRLILKGKLLSPDSALLNTFKVEDSAFVHCVVSEQPPAPRTAHTSIDMEPPQYPEVNDDPATRRGFDRLRTSHGFSIVDVAAIRSSFGPQVHLFAMRQPPVEGESQDDRRYRMEDAWMHRQGPASEFALNTTMVAARAEADRREGLVVAEAEQAPTPRAIQDSGGSRDFIWGFVMGSALGFTMLFWLWNIPMSHQQKMGIIAGVCTSLLLSIIRRQIAQL